MTGTLQVLTLGLPFTRHEFLIAAFLSLTELVVIHAQGSQINQKTFKVSISVQPKGTGAAKAKAPVSAPTPLA